MKNNFFIAGNLKTNYPKDSKLIFVSKYDLEIQTRNKNLQNSTSFVYNYNKSKKDSSSINFIKKKILKYRKSLAKKLNKAHNVNFGENYWGIILDRYLFILIQVIYFNNHAIKKIIKKYKNIKISEEDLLVPKIHTLREFAFLESDKILSNYIKTKIFTFHKKKDLKTLEYKKKYFEKRNSLFFLTKKFFKNYIKLFKPILLLNPYLGKINSIKLFLFSLGKILPIPESLILNSNSYSFNYDLSLRNKLKVEIEDKFDQIFNQVNKELLPASLVENFTKFYFENKDISDRINKIGSASLLINNDRYKFLSASISQKNGKLFSLQHGANIGIYAFSIQEELEKKYCTKRFCWTQKDGIGNTHLQKLNNFKNKKILDQILIFTTAYHYHDFSQSTLFKMYLKKYHPVANLNFNLFENFSKKLKQKTSVKLYPKKNSFLVYQDWKKKYGNEIKIYYKNNLNSYKLMSSAKIVILNDFSTGLCELLYLNKPTIIVCESLVEYNESFINKIKKLKKINFYFDDSMKASKFLNSNYDNIEVWWQKITANKEFINFKKHLFNESKKFSYNKLAKSILEI